MPNFLTIATTMMDVDAPVSTNPSTTQLFISTNKWKVLLQCVLLIQIFLNIRDVQTMDTWLFVFYVPPFHLTSFTRLSRCFSSPSIMKIISMGEREIFFLMKRERILYLIEVSLFIPILSPLASGVYTIPLDTTSISILLLGIRV